MGKKISWYEFGRDLASLGGCRPRKAYDIISRIDAPQPDTRRMKIAYMDTRYLCEIGSGRDEQGRKLYE